MLTRLRENIGTIWCKLTHKSVMWPVHGQFQCRTCGRRYPAFEGPPIAVNGTATVSATINAHGSTVRATV